MRKQSLSCAQPVLRDETDTERARYKSESEEESRRVNNILRQLMALWKKTTDTKRTSNPSLKPGQFYEREEQYLCNLRTETEDDMICPGT